jgi:hypothetical protein
MLEGLAGTSSGDGTTNVSSFNPSQVADPLLINKTKKVKHLCAGILNNIWGLGTELEVSCRTGPPGYPAWRNWFLEIESWAP